MSDMRNDREIKSEIGWEDLLKEFQEEGFKESECSGNFVTVDSENKWEEVIRDKKAQFPQSKIWSITFKPYFNHKKEGRYPGYLAGTPEITGMNTFFLSIIERVYSEWMEREYIEKEKESSDIIVLGKPGEREKIIEQLKKQVIEEFVKQTSLIYKIDINLINGIAATFYESTSCHASLCFVLSDHSIDCEMDMEMDEEEAFLKGSERKYRKKLQMVQKNQSLLFLKEKSQDSENYTLMDSSYVWKAQGLINKEKLNRLKETKISFSIQGHMVWDMEINGKLAVSYKCGQYRLYNKNTCCKQFAKQYKNVFQTSTVPENVGKIVSKAFELDHGLVLIFIEKDAVNSREEIKKAIGFRMKKEEILTDVQLESISLIDGAILLTEEGMCYKYGMILNSMENGDGELARGSRYNTTRNYIINCKMEKIQALAIIISEDKMVNIISTGTL